MNEIAKDTNSVYLDYAAATPLLPAAFVAMEPFLRLEYGNPNSIHKLGVRARQAVELARAQVAQAVQVRPEYVIFTGGGTEGNNLALLGVIESLRKEGREYAYMEVVTTKIEHPSITKTMEKLAELGVTVKYVAVDTEGRIVLADLKELLSAKTVLVSCAYANSEIGTVQALRQIGKVIAEAEKKYNTIIYFHVDAAQAPLWLSCQFDSTGADFLVLDAAKCCGPKGVGVLVKSKRATLSPIMFGGGQEQDLRSGTENVAGIVGAGVAFQAAQADWRERAERVIQVRNQAILHLMDVIPEMVLNGALGDNRLANNINISIPGLDTEYATVVLDTHGFAVSTKSACAGAGGGESVVVREISADPARAASTLRISLSPDTTLEQIKSLTAVLKKHIEQMKRLTS
ncbi:cysteine desulfurase [Candidatus Nomurabacteria bacterium]|nr:cysteine desulfurase [Candidatus Kaiserbacteria bacterium]MCB9814778.1 cysteine desulfurase [Candidatus Nomurabacteria bacterium]